jgi:hypothetical protein
MSGMKTRNMANTSHWYPNIVHKKGRRLRNPEHVPGHFYTRMESNKAHCGILKILKKVYQGLRDPRILLRKSGGQLQTTTKAREQNKTQGNRSVAAEN